MKLESNEGRTIYLHNTKIVFKVTLEQTNNSFSTVLVTNPPLTGPALHRHPHGPETFYIIEGEYTFTLNNDTLEAKEGDFVFVPQNQPHKYRSGKNGGKMLVTTPAYVEIYFIHIADKLLKESVSLDYEFEYAKQHGQVFIEKGEHYSQK